MIYLPLVLYIILFEVFRKKRQPVDTLTLFGFKYLLTYAFTLMLWLFLPSVFADTPYSIYYNAASDPKVASVFYLSYLLFVVFYCLIDKVRFKYSVGFRYIKTSVFSVEGKILIVVFIFVMVVVFNIFSSGGVSQYIAYGNEARHNKVSFGIGGYFNYLLSSTDFLIVLLSFLYLSTKRFVLKFLISVMVLLLFVGMLSRGGRGGIVFSIIYLMIFMYSMGYVRVRFRTLLALFVSSIVVLFVVFYMRKITQNIMLGENFLNDIDFVLFLNSLGDIVIYPFKYPVHMIYTVSEFFNNPYIYNYPRLGADIMSAFALVIPGVSGTDFGLPVLPDIINQSVMGKTNGYIPPGWVAWALIDGGVIFLILKLFWSALFCVFIDKSYRLIAIDPLGKAVYFILALFLIDILFVGTAMNLVRGNLGSLLLLLLLFYIPFLRVGKLKLMRR